MTASRTLWIAVALIASWVWTAPGTVQAASDDRAGQAAAYIQSLGADLLAIQAGAGDGAGAGEAAAAARSARLEGLFMLLLEIDISILVLIC